MIRGETQGFSRETGEGALDGAARRLDEAVARLEHGVHRLLDAQRRHGAAARGEASFDADRTQLAAELDASRARERALEAITAEASAALGRAADEVRSALADSPAGSPGATELAAAHGVDFLAPDPMDDEEAAAADYGVGTDAAALDHHEDKDDPAEDDGEPPEPSIPQAPIPQADGSSFAADLFTADPAAPDSPGEER